MIFSGACLQISGYVQPASQFNGTIFNDTLNTSTGVVFTIPAGLAAGLTGGSFSVLFSSYNSSILFDQGLGLGTYGSPTRILDATVSAVGLNTSNLPVPVQFSFETTLSGSKLCVFWDEVAARWSTTGVSTISSAGGITACASSHLTGFAVLVVGIMRLMHTFF
jgi:hypothetical protein